MKSTTRVSRTAFASLSNYVGKGVGLLWTAILVAQLSIADYGAYAMAFAASGLIVGFLDNPYFVRSLRVSVRDFLSDRRARTTTAGTLVLLGSALWMFAPTVGFAVVIAGGEVATNTLKSSSLRAARPNLVSLIDLFRQLLGIGLGVAAVALIPAAGFSIVVAAYCLPYLAVLLFCAVRYGFGRPWPRHGSVKEWARLSFGALAGAGYAQGDVLLLGLVANSSAAGVYSIASMVAWSAASVLQNYAYTHVEELRQGIAAAGMKPEFAVAVALGAIVGITGYVLILIGLMPPLGYVLAILSAFTALRAINHVLTVRLSVWGYDTLRLFATLSTLTVDLLLLFVMREWGSVGAAIAASGAELLLFVIFLLGARRATSSLEFGNDRRPE